MRNKRVIRETVAIQLCYVCPFCRLSKSIALRPNVVIAVVVVFTTTCRSIILLLHYYYYYTVIHENGATFVLALTLSNVNRFLTLYYCWKANKMFNTTHVLIAGKLKAPICFEITNVTI